MLEAAKSRDVTSLKNWVTGTGHIARAERAYLDRTEDLIALADSADDGSTKLGPWIEDLCIMLRSLLNAVSDQFMVPVVRWFTLAVIVFAVHFLKFEFGPMQLLSTSCWYLR